MKILQIHNYYRSLLPSGENEVVTTERGLLRNAGHEVFEFSRSNDEWHDNKLRTAASSVVGTIWNWGSQALVRSEIRANRPDVAHLHNTFPLLSPSVVVAAARSNAACVMTLHNYRIFCSNGVLTRDGKACSLCIDKQSVMPAIRYACYRDSRFLTIPVAAGLKLHQTLGTWANNIDAFIVMSGFQKAMMARAGLPASKIHIKPHAVDDPGPPVPWNERNPRIVFIGRLTEEKGLQVLLEAWRLLGKSAPPLDIIGQGPLATRIDAFIRENALADHIHLLGGLTHDKTLAHLSQSKLLVMPSIWDETFGLPVFEAFAAGVPVIASNRAHFPETMSATNGGWTYPAQSAEQLAKLVNMVWTDEAALQARSAAARTAYEKHYTPQASLEKLLDIYQLAIASKSQRNVEQAF